MKRYSVLDGIRGLTLISMICYHTVWDLVYLFHKNWNWYRSFAGSVWQQSICFIFILLSGFCWSFGRKKWKRAILLVVCGTLISVITWLFTPQNRVLFGILTFLGTAAFILNLVEPLLKKWTAVAGLTGNLFLFVVTKEVNSGFLGYEGIRFFELPEVWYHNLFTAYLGFPPGGFYSSDYFAVLPWIFLYLTGYYLHKIMEEYDTLKYLENGLCFPVEWIGRHTLIIYMLHQPVILGILTLTFSFLNKT